MGGAALCHLTQTIELMRAVLEETAAKVPKHLRTASVKVELAELILKFAAGGERDPSRLGTFAFVHVMERHRAPYGMDDGRIV
jgi:hypothetical protein